MNLDVVIVTYNSASHLPTVLETLPEDASVFVIDNASTDSSAAIAEAHGATVVRGTVNAGFASACNRGAALGEAKKILFLNPDATIDVEALGRLLAAMDADAQIGVAAPRLLTPDGHRQRVQWPYPSARGAWREALGWSPWYEESVDGFVIGACLAVRREAFEAAGGFDERFWLYGEEADLCRRVEDLGWTVRRVPAATALHVGGASGGDAVDSGTVFEHFVRGGEHFVHKHGGRGALASYRTAGFVGSVGRGLLGVGARSAEHRRRVLRMGRTVTRSPNHVPLDSPATAASGKGLVVCSLEAWDDIWRRNQFFVRELLAADPDLRILFVEPAYDVVHELRRRSGRRHRPGLRPVDGEGRVVRFEPVKWAPRRLGGFADRSRDRQVLDAVEALGFVAPRLWINDPSYATLADHVRWPAVYDITDDWTEAGDPGTRSAAAANEARLFERCEQVVVCSPRLFETRRAIRDDVVLIPNAVDVEALRQYRHRPTDLPEGDTAVYVGTLHADRLDVDLTVELASELDGVSVVLVGPDALESDARRRLDAAGVVRLGPRPYDQVPGYLQHASALIVPHVVSDFTESLDPIKSYECLAVGTPTVATPVAGFRDLGAPIRTADRADFTDVVREVIADAGEAEPQEVPSWTTRAAAFSRVLDEATDREEAERKLRVVFFDHCAKLSGGELALARLVSSLDEVDPLVLLGQRGPLERVLEDSGIAVEVFEIDGRLNGLPKNATGISALPVEPALLMVGSVLRLARLLRRKRPDVVHTNSLKAGIIGSLAARLAGIPTVWHVHDRIASDYLPRSTVQIMRAAIRHLPSAVIVNSRATRATLPNVDDVHVIPNALPDGWFDRPDVEDRAGGRLRIVMIGRLAPWKGQDIFIRAFAGAFERGQAQAIIAGEALFGEDQYSQSLRDLTTDLDLTGSVDFIGHVNDVRSLIQSADVVVHASTIPEPFGQTVVEAMALGKAVVAAAAGGPAEIITDGVDGLLVEPGSSEALQAALRRLAENPELRRNLGDAGRKRADDFSGSVVGPMVEKVFSEVAPLATRSSARRDSTG